MNKKYIYIIILLVFIAFGFYTFYTDNTIKFKWYDFNDGLNLAKKENKKILINVYADWCKWCKKMESEVYPNTDIKSYIEKTIIPIKFNGEAQNKINYDGQIYSHSEFIEAFGINGFPATIFMTSETEPITVLPGYHDAKSYLNILKFIGEDFYLKMTYDEYLNSLK